MEKTLHNLAKLSDQKLKEVADFAEFLLNKIEDRSLTEGIQQLAAGSNSFHFLEDEQDLYSSSDLKEIYEKK